jgi:hypothetical protein
LHYFISHLYAMTSSSPPSPPSRPHPRHLKHSPSPLNPATHPFPIPTRRNSGTGGPCARKLSTRNAPTRFSLRSPLSFVSPFPSSTSITNTSMSSSPGWQLRTPPSSLNSTSGPHLSSPDDYLSVNVDLLNKSKSNPSNSPLHIKIPSSHSLLNHGTSPLSPSPSNETHIPSPLDKLDYLDNIPPSPPIMDPARLLELPPDHNRNSESQISIASPFVNLNSSPTRTPIGSTPVPSRRAHINTRRGSALARDFNRLDIDFRDADGSDADADNPPDDPPICVPSPSPPRRV